MIKKIIKIIIRRRRKRRKLLQKEEEKDKVRKLDTEKVVREWQEIEDDKEIE